MRTMNRTLIYTDGSCFLTRPHKPGGWAFVIPGEFEVSGGTRETTNNRMELTSVIEALKFTDKNSQISIWSDSKYVIKGITEFIHNWRKRKWDKVKNVDLWKELDILTYERDIDWNWVKAHNGNIWNERADLLAKSEAHNFS